MDRHPKLQDVVLSRDRKRKQLGIKQLLVSKEELPPEPWNLNQEEEDQALPPHIKKEQEELWSNQEKEQLQELEEADIIKFPFSAVPVKSEDDDVSDIQQLSMGEEEQRWSPRLEQQDLEPPNIEEELEELWSSKTRSVWNLNPNTNNISYSSELKKELKRHMCGGEISQFNELWSSKEGDWLGLEDEDNHPFTVVPVRSEDDEEKSESSQLHQSPTEDNRETEPLTSSSAQHMGKEDDGEDCGGQQRERNSHPHAQLGPEPRRGRPDCGIRSGSQSGCLDRPDLQGPVRGRSCRT
ncbi:hypothetical protein Q5P01_018912 [Channa striata]|uniref:Uncharacterized protein n=1 Tax=Channa striata TaxID=64152 RepID=A0AA88M620_CHASR|nr:hypothetical protein Q5P01_018912 [Channa striata]